MRIEIKNCRIDKTFKSLQEAKKSALVTFITAGDPDFNLSKKILLNLPNAGADLIEIGVPFSDPMADGPIIQKSYKRALKNGVTLEKVLELVKKFRKTNNFTPIILMGYYNPIYQIGLKKFLNLAEESGVDGILIVDLPPENDNEIIEQLKKSSLKLIRLATPTTDKKRLKKILKNSSGFLYYVSITGITGTSLGNLSQVKKTYKKFKMFSKLPIVVGFGINTLEKAKSVSAYADGVVVGSALVREIDKNMDQKSNIKNNIIALVKKFAKAVSIGKK